MIKIMISFVIGIAIGSGCRFFDIPVPAPPKLLGALLIVSITVGYLAADRLVTRRAGPGRTAAAQITSSNAPRSR
jgi:XapX domain-containing protein